jgi:hypothetical protein
VSIGRVEPTTNGGSGAFHLENWRRTVWFAFWIYTGERPMRRRSHRGQFSALLFWSAGIAHTQKSYSGSAFWFIYQGGKERVRLGGREVRTVSTVGLWGFKNPHRYSVDADLTRFGCIFSVPRVFYFWL